MRVLLGVTGGIAAFKVASVLRRLRDDGHDVWVVPTPASLNFVGRSTWEALSGHPAPSDIFENVPGVTHVRLGQDAEAILVAPATADFLASMVAGSARDLLSNAMLASQAPVVVAPAMHTEMWHHPATQANVTVLRERGVTVIEPAVGKLTSGDSGPGRLPDPDDVVAAFYGALDGRAEPASSPFLHDLAGLRVLVSAGGTRERWDAVRYLGNDSSGRQGCAVAEAARERGAAVTVVAANMNMPLGEGISRIDVESAAELHDAMLAHAADSDVVVMAAAVADFKPVEQPIHKVKKTGGGVSLQLEPTVDVLAALVAARATSQTIVGFAAETGDDAHSVQEYGRDKARRKGADLTVINDVRDGQVFGSGHNDVVIVDAQGADLHAVSGSKMLVAHALWDVVVDSRAHAS